jgi:hypothetical protein
MTYDEYKNLKPGDKVVFIEPLYQMGLDWVGRTYRKQEENGGYLTVAFTKGSRLVYIEERIGTYLFPEEVELYKPQPWSYERDY